MELDAVFTSIPSFFNRSMMSWDWSPRSRARLKTLTLPIRTTLLVRLPAALAFRRALGHRRGLGLRGAGLALRGEPLAFEPLRFRGGRLRGRALREEALLLGGGGVPRIPLRLGRGRGLAEFLHGLGPDA